MTDLTEDTFSAPRKNAEAPISGELQRLIIGGIGGTAPIIATLMAGEYENTAGHNAVYLYYVGIAVRALLFFAVGAFFVWLHQAVRTRYAVFQLGVAAPALIVAMAEAKPAEAADMLTGANQVAAEVRVAYLENTNQDTVMSDAPPPDMGNVEQSTTTLDALAPDTIIFAECTIWDGLFGRPCGK